MSDRPSQRAAHDPSDVLPWAITAALLLAQQVASKAVRDGLFLSQLSAAALPAAMLWSALLAVPIVLAVSRAIARFSPGRVAALLLLASATLFALEALLLPKAGVSAAWILYVHIATLGGTTISAFYSCIGERFDPRSARRASGVIMSGSTLGGLVGGLLVTWGASFVGDRALLSALCASNVVCAIALWRLAADGGGEAAALPTFFAAASLRKSSYLRSLAYLVLLTGFVSALLDYGFKLAASATLGSGPQLVQLFGAFHTGTALLTALIQLLLARPALERLGLSATLAVLPVTLLVAGALAPLMPTLWSRALSRGASSILESSLFRSAYEPLYTPLSQRTRRSTKTLIDVSAGRLGEALASGVLLLLAQLARGHMSASVLLVALLGAGLSLILSLRLHNGYVAALADSLRKGSVQLHAADVSDHTTRLTLSQTHAELTAAELRAQIAALRSAHASGQLAHERVDRVSAPASALNEKPLTSAATPSKLAMPLVAPAHVELMSAVEALLSADKARVVPVLERVPLDPRLVPFAIPLLQHGALIEPITSALKHVVDECLGQLIDALLDTKQPLLVRRRLPRIIKHAVQPRAAAGLLTALRAPERELRHRAANALAELTESHPELTPDSRVVFDLTRDELRTQGDEPLHLHHLFALLSLSLERDALRLARRALSYGDERQRGTALEYLHNTLPEPLRSELIVRLEAGELRTVTSQARNSRPPPSP